MTAWYVFAAVVGWPLVAFFVLFGDSADGGLGEGSVDAGGDIGGDSGSLASTIGSFLSLTGLGFFAAFFGLTGLLVGWFGAGTVVTLVSAVALGLFAGWFHGMLIRWLQRTSSTSEHRDVTGMTARVSVPLGVRRKGRVAVDVDGQRVSYVALPYRTDETVYQVGETVVVIEIEDGIALVAPMDDLG